MVLYSTLFFGLVIHGCGNRFQVHAEKERSDYSPLINDWKTLSRLVKLRYFSPSNYNPTVSEVEMWALGENIDCRVHCNLTVELKLPDSFIESLPVKIHFHGFTDTAKRHLNYVDAWMQANIGEVNVILVDWSSLAFPIFRKGNFFYDAAAINAIDVGNYIGRCLAELSKLHKSDPQNFHLVGFSLGAQLAGMAGRTYREVTGEQLGRITGLDPAGPNFFKGNKLRDVEHIGLYEKRLRSEDAELVDVIHSSTLMGELAPMGDLDFYPNGGELQPGCYAADLIAWGACSHLKAEHFYLDSVVNATRYPAKSCSRAGCLEDDIISESPTSVFMGEQCWDFVEPSDLSGSGLYYVEVCSLDRIMKRKEKKNRKERKLRRKSFEEEINEEII